MDRRQFATRSLAAAAGAVLHRPGGYAAAPLSGEQAPGYTERYGLIYTDFRNQRRTVKDSGYWYARVAASNRLDV